MEVLEVTKNRVIAAFKSGNQETKNMLKKLFPLINFNQKVTDRIKSWEDVVNKVGLDEDRWEEMIYSIEAICPLTFGELKCAIAHIKILLLAKALNEGWELSKEAENNGEGYGIYWLKRDGVSGEANFQVGSACAPGYVRASGSFGASYWNLVPRLSFKTRELAEYAVLQFPEIWREYYNNYEKKTE